MLPTCQSLLCLNYLAPDIVAIILEGKQPLSLRLEDLSRKVFLGLWDEQSKSLGFVMVDRL